MNLTIFLVGVVATLMATMALAETVEGRVIGVADGDTITVLTKRYEREQPVVERASYATTETSAKVARRGLWRDLDGGVPPMPPWDWRRAKKAD